MATLKTDMCSACSFVIPTMQPAMTAADLFAQWMSSASHNAQASAPFLSTFSQTPQQHYPAGHTLPQSMQPQCTTADFTQPFAPIPQQQQQPQLLGHTVPQPTQAPFATSAFTQSPSLHTFNTPHHNTAMPGFQPPPHHNAAIPNPQLSPPQNGSLLNYQPTPHSTTTTLVQPLPATPFSQQFPTTTASTPPMSHNKHNRTRSRTTRKKHRSSTTRRHRRKSTKRHHSHYRSRHRSTTLRSRHHKFKTPITTSTPAPFTSQATFFTHWQVQIQPSITHRTQTSSIFSATHNTTTPHVTTTTTTNNNTTTTSSTTTVTIRLHR